MTTKYTLGAPLSFVSIVLAFLTACTSGPGETAPSFKLPYEGHVAFHTLPQAHYKRTLKDTLFYHFKDYSTYRILPKVRELGQQMPERFFEVDKRLYYLHQQGVFDFGSRRFHPFSNKKIASIVSHSQSIVQFNGQIIFQLTYADEPVISDQLIHASFLQKPGLAAFRLPLMEDSLKLTFLPVSRQPEKEIPANVFPGSSFYVSMNDSSLLISYKSYPHIQSWQSQDTAARLITRFKPLTGFGQRPFPFGETSISKRKVYFKGQPFYFEAYPEGQKIYRLLKTRKKLYLCVADLEAGVSRYIHIPADHGVVTLLKAGNHVFYIKVKFEKAHRLVQHRPVEELIDLYER